MNNEYELYHYGVKGMKWGVRRKRDVVSTQERRMPLGAKSGPYEQNRANSERLRNSNVVKSDYSKRIARDHAGPGGWVGTKRTIEKDKKDLKELGEGKHLSYGIGKKRQAKLDARDKASLEKRIAKNEAKLQAKSDRKQFRADVKETKKRGLLGDYKIDAKTGQMKVTQFYNSKSEKIGMEYAQHVMHQARKEQTLSSLAGTSAVIAGATALAALVEFKRL